MIEHNNPNSAEKAVIRIVPEETHAQVQSLPQDVNEYFDNARKVLDAGVPDAAAVQLRKTLEAAAAHHGIAKGTLGQRIEKLIQQGLITKDFGRVLGHVRRVGNVGAHASDESVDETTARTAYEFTTQVLRNLFEIPAALMAIEALAAIEEKKAQGGADSGS